MARDFKTSFILPTQTGTTGGALGCTVNGTQVFRSGLNTLSITSAAGSSTAALTALSSDYFFVDEQVADQWVINNLSDGTKGEGLYSAAAPLGIRITPTGATTGIFTAAGHGLVQGQTVVFTSVTGGGGVIRPFRPYSVVFLSSSTFSVTEKFSTVVLLPTSAVSASVLYATNPTFGLGPLTIPGQAGSLPEALPGQYVRPMYLRVVVQPNIAASAATGAVNVTNLTVSLSGSYVRGFNGTAGTIADFDAAPYATVASRTFQQVFWDGLNAVPNTGAIFTVPVQTDFPFLRASLSFGRTETATTGLIAAGSTINVGMSLVTGRENAQV
jgi:hypothetical protein